MSAISTNYRPLTPDELPRVAAECAEAWKAAEIPLRQYELAVKPELEAWRRGGSVAPYDALIRCLRQLPLDVIVTKPRLLDVGASSGYYSEVIRTSRISPNLAPWAHFEFKYTGIDFSPAFRSAAFALYPDIDFDCGDARDLPYHDEYFPLVLNSAVIMHTLEYAQVIKETARVASQFAIFHRTPILRNQPTSYYLKEGYGCPMLEAHFNERELLDLFYGNGLRLMYYTDVFNQGDFGHRSYVLRKECPLAHQSV